LLSYAPSEWLKRILGLRKVLGPPFAFHVPLEMDAIWQRRSSVR
jgi:hypothetical protein